MCGGTLRKSLLMLGAGAWLLGSVTCVPTGDQIRYIVQSDILALISGTIQVIFGAAVQAVTTASQA